MSRLRELDDRVRDDRVRGDDVPGDGVPGDGMPGDGMRGNGMRGNGMRGNGAAAELRAVQRVATYVLFALVVVVLLGVLFTQAPTNVGNVIVRNVLLLAEEVASPFKDVFTPKKAPDAVVINYLVAAAAYLMMGIAPGRVPVGGKK